MPSENQPVIVKKYANRRLYHTGTSAYVTLDDLANMVRNGEDFIVQDAKTGEDLTRSVLAQIIFEQEAKQGQQLLPIAFLRQLIRFYGDSLQAVVPSYLQLSLDSLTKDQTHLREHMAQAFGPAAFQAMEEQVKANMAFFTDTLRMFNPLATAMEPASTAKSEEPKKPASSAKEIFPDDEIELLRRQVSDMQQKLEKLSRLR